MPQAIGVLIAEAVAYASASAGVTAGAAAGASASGAAVAGVSTAATTAAAVGAVVGTETIVAGITVAEAIGTLALAGASFAFAPGVPSIPSNQQQDVIKQALTARRRFYGLNKVGGIMAFIDVIDVAPAYWIGHPGWWLYTVVVVASQEWDSFQEYWVGDGRAILGGSGELEFCYPDGSIDADRILGEGNDSDPFKLIYDSRLGVQNQGAMSLMTHAFPGAWTSKARLQGCVCFAKAEYNVQGSRFSYVYPQGPWSIAHVGRTAKVFDPRDGTQNINVPSTWKYSANAALVILDYVKHKNGMGLPLSLVTNVLDDWSAKADICDEVVPTKDGGSCPRYQLCGGYDLTSTPRDILPLMLEPINGMLKMQGDGSIVLDLAEADTANFTIQRADIISYKNLQRGLNRDETKNEIHARYTDPLIQFQSVEADVWLNNTSIDVYGNQSTSLDLGWCPTHSQARRIMKVEAFKGDPEWSMELEVNVQGLNLLGERFFNLNIPELGINGDQFEKLTWEFDYKTSKVTMSIRSMPTSALNWAPKTEEGIRPGVIIRGSQDKNLTLDPPQGMHITVQDDGTAHPSMSLTITNPNDSNFYLWAQYRVVDDSISDDSASWTAFNGNGSSGYTKTTNALSANVYKARCWFFKYNGGTWSYQHNKYSAYNSVTGINVQTLDGSKWSPPFPVINSLSLSSTVNINTTSPTYAYLAGLNIYRNSAGIDFNDPSTTNVSGLLPYASGTTNTYNDVLPAVGEYWYWTTAQNLEGDESDPTGPKYVYVGLSGLPNPPQGLNLQAGQNQITVNWILNPVGDGVTNYLIYAAPGNDIDFASCTLIATLPNTAVTYNYTGLDDQSPYTIFVVAQNGTGNNPMSMVNGDDSTTLPMLYPMDFTNGRLVVVTSSPYAILPDDRYLDIDNQSGGPLELDLPDGSSLKSTGPIVIRDVGAIGAGTYPFTIMHSGTTIDTIMVDGAWSTVRHNMTNWRPTGGA